MRAARRHEALERRAAGDALELMLDGGAQSLLDARAGLRREGCRGRARRQRGALTHLCHARPLQALCQMLFEQLSRAAEAVEQRLGREDRHRLGGRLRGRELLRELGQHAAQHRHEPREIHRDHLPHKWTCTRRLRQRRAERLRQRRPERRETRRSCRATRATCATRRVSLPCGPCGPCTRLNRLHQSLESRMAVKERRVRHRVLALRRQGHELLGRREHSLPHRGGRRALRNERRVGRLRLLVEDRREEGLRERVALLREYALQAGQPHRSREERLGKPIGLRPEHLAPAREGRVGRHAVRRLRPCAQVAQHSTATRESLRGVRSKDGAVEGARDGAADVDGHVLGGLDGGLAQLAQVEEDLQRRARLRL